MRCSRCYAGVDSSSDSPIYQVVPASKSEFLRLQNRVDDLSNTVMNIYQAMLSMQNMMEALTINNNVTSIGGTGIGGDGGNGIGGAGGTGASANGGKGGTSTGAGSANGGAGGTASGTGGDGGSGTGGGGGSGSGGGAASIAGVRALMYLRSSIFASNACMAMRHPC